MKQRAARVEAACCVQVPYCHFSQNCSSGLETSFLFFQNVQKTSMTTILEAGTMHCNSAKMASAEVKSEVNYDTVRQTLRETIR